MFTRALSGRFKLADVEIKKKPAAKKTATKKKAATKTKKTAAAPPISESESESDSEVEEESPVKPTKPKGRPAKGKIESKVVKKVKAPAKIADLTKPPAKAKKQKEAAPPESPKSSSSKTATKLPSILDEILVGTPSQSYYDVICYSITSSKSY